MSTCVDGFRFPKKELLQQVCNAIARRNTYECRLYTDRRMFISGSDMLDKGTGEVVSMGKDDKIAANARCRKTERIISVVKAWKSDKSIDENIESIRAWCDGIPQSRGAGNDKKLPYVLKPFIACLVLVDSEKFLIGYRHILWLYFAVVIGLIIFAYIYALPFRLAEKAGKLCS